MSTGERGGVLNAWVLDRQGGGRPLTHDELAAWLPDQGLLWVHIDYSARKAREWIRRQSGLPPVASDILLMQETRPRSIPQDSGLLLTLRGVNTSPGAIPEDMVSIRVWLEHDRIVTSRRRHVTPVDDIYDAIKRQQGPCSAGEFIVALIDGVADRIGLAVDELDSEIEAAEDSVTQLQVPEFRRRLSELRRRIAHLRRYLAPQRDALDRLYRMPGSVLGEADIQVLREHADRITRYLEDLDLIRERAMVVQEDFLGHLAHEQNRRIYVLSLVAFLFLPMTFVTGLLGMNVGGIPGAQSPNAFIAVSVGMIVAALILFWLFRRKKWI